jgi:hypothetical protein
MRRAARLSRRAVRKPANEGSKGTRRTPPLSRIGWGYTAKRSFARFQEVCSTKPGADAAIIKVAVKLINQAPPNTVPEAITIRQLDGTAVLCQGEGCDRAAMYLFVTSAPDPSYSAYCEGHARQLAGRIRLALPPSRETGSRRWSHASA